MKNKRIITSLNQITVPADRKEAMLENVFRQADAERASLEKERKVHTEYRPNQTTNPNGKNSYRIPRKRKALLIAIAAILLLLSACAAYAIYWSSTQRAKEYSQSEQAVDDRRVLAERSADEIIAGTTFYGAISGSAEVDGVTLTLTSASYWPNDDPPELHLAFNAADAKANDMSRLYDFDYTLTVGGKTYPAYAKADSTMRALPIITQADAMAEGAEYEMWFRMDDGQAVTDGTPMTLAGELYAYDENEQRGDNLGSFLLDFTYTVPHAQIEAERERLIAEAFDELDARAEAQAETLSGLPDETTPLGVTQDEYTFTDALVTAEGFVLGQTVVTRGADFAVFYMDGYRFGGEAISSIFTPDTSRPQNVAWEVAYYGTSESVSLYPWYAPLDELPETVLIAVLRDAGSTQRRKAGLNGYEEELLTYTWDAVELLLRVNPRTGEIMLPKDDAERMAWRAETERLAADGRNDDLLATLSGEQTLGGVTVRLKQLHVQRSTQEVYVFCEVDGLYYPVNLGSCPMTLYIDGISFGTVKREYVVGGFTEETAQTWVDSYGGWQIHNGWIESQGFDVDSPPSRWPDTFTVRVVFELSDRSEDWSLLPIGTFDVTTTVTTADIVRGTFEELYDLLI